MEKLYPFNQSKTKLVEKIIDDEVAMINHMILNYQDALPEHYANSNVYMIIIRGEITLELADRPSVSYPQGSIVNIPYQTKMNVSNQNQEQLEFFVVKAPSPSAYEKLTREV